MNHATLFVHLVPDEHSDKKQLSAQNFIRIQRMKQETLRKLWFDSAAQTRGSSNLGPTAFANSRYSIPRSWWFRWRLALAIVFIIAVVAGMYLGTIVFR